MKKSVTALLLMLIFTISCSVNNSPVSTESNSENTTILPTAEIFYDLPNAIASPVTNEDVVLAKISEDSNSEKTLYDAYKPIPIYLYYVEKAKKELKNFIQQLNQYNFEGAGTFQLENGVTINIISTKDSTIDNEPKVKFFYIHILKNNKTVLKMNYFMNTNHEYRGNFIYFENEGIDSTKSLYIHYNGWNKSILGQRMTMIYHNTLVPEKQNDPQTIRVTVIKKNEKIFVSGISYHPTFADSFFGVGPHAYVFKILANTEKNTAILKASFIPTDKKIDKDKIFTDYTLDKITLKKGTEIFKEELVKNDSLAKIVLYSIEKKKTIEFNNNLELLAIFTYKPTKTIHEITEQDVVTFIELNKKWVLMDKGLREFYRFIMIKQPIFLKSNATFVGDSNNVDSVTVNQLEINEEELEDFDAIETDYEDVVTYSPNADSLMEIDVEVEESIQ